MHGNSTETYPLETLGHLKFSTVSKYNSNLNMTTALIVSTTTDKESLEFSSKKN